MPDIFIDSDGLIGTSRPADFRPFDARRRGKPTDRTTYSLSETINDDSRELVQKSHRKIGARRCPLIMLPDRVPNGYLTTGHRSRERLFSKSTMRTMETDENRLIKSR